MKNRNLLIYRITTALFSLILLAGAVTYFVKHEMVVEMFASLGVPAVVVYPLAIAKILGVAALWLVKNDGLQKFVYACFALDLIAAVGAHLNAGDGGFNGPILPLLLLTLSFIFYRKVQA